MSSSAAADGYARDRGDLFIGLDIVAAIVVDHTGAPRYGLSGIAIAGQVQEAAMERLGEELVTSPRGSAGPVLGQELIRRRHLAASICKGE